MPVLISGGLRDAAKVHEVFERTGAEAVLLARGSLGNPWIFEQVLGARDGRADAARRSSPSSTGCSTAPSSTSASARAARYLRKFYPWYVTRLGEGKVLQDRLQRTQSIAEARAALGIAPSLVPPRLRRSRRAGTALSGRYTCPPPSPTRRNPPPRAGFVLSPAGRSPSRPPSHGQGHAHAQGRHPHAGRSREAQERARVPLDGEAARGRRAHQGGARVRRHLRERRVRRRQERAGDARVEDRPARGEAARARR